MWSSSLLNRLSPFSGFMLLPFFLWGTAMVAMKGVMPLTTPWLVAGVRLVPAGLLVLAFALISGKPQPRGWQAWLWISLFALVDGTLFQGFLAYGLSRTSAGLGSVMIDSQPIVVALLALWLFGERVGLVGWLGLGLGILGISLIGLPDSLIAQLWQGHGWGQDWGNGAELFNRLVTSGEFWMLLAALAMAVGTVMMQRVCRYADPVMATGWHMVIGGLPLLAFALFNGQGTNVWAGLDVSAWLNLGYATVFGSALAYGIFFFYAAKGNLTSLSALTFLTPVFALIFGHLLLAERLTPIQLSGVGVTLISIYLVNQRQQLAQRLNLSQPNWMEALEQQGHRPQESSQNPTSDAQARTTDPLVVKGSPTD
jgi:drug/metabolite transporter (DMT)-like permease